MNKINAILQYNEQRYETDLSQPVDISIPISREGTPNAFHLRKPGFATVEAGSFVGDVNRGGSCNCEDILINPHGNGTHTECAGHISRERITITGVLKRHFFLARLISLTTEEKSEGKVLSVGGLKKTMPDNPEGVEALVIRTMPNDSSKKHRDYSGSDPACFSTAFIDHLNKLGILHLLTDLPSLDKEDDALLKAHHAFFGYPEPWNLDKTVTEMIYVPDECEDGIYLLSLTPAPIETDASPCKPLLFKTRLLK